MTGLGAARGSHQVLAGSVQQAVVISQRLNDSKGIDASRV